MTKPQIVLDTNVLVTAMRSRRGTAFKLLSRVGSNDFDIHLSVPLVMEYEEVLLRQLEQTVMTPTDVDNLLNYLCSVAYFHEIFYLWRPYLRDPDDEFILELAVTARCDYIITYNLRDFRGIEKFGVHAITPAELLAQLGDLSR